MNTQIYINDYNIVSPLGMDISQNWDALMANKSGIEMHDFSKNLEHIPAALIPNATLETAATKAVCPPTFSRMEKMLYLALLPLTIRNTISSDSLLILSTTKGNVAALEGTAAIPTNAYLHTSAQKIADHFGFCQPPVVVSNACVSGIMAIHIAKALIQMRKYKDAYVIAADEVTPFIVSGFNAFQAMSKTVCKPYDRERDGINLGEAAAAAYISTHANAVNAFKIAGSAAINDANHISGPSRTGEGLYRSIASAMKEADIPSSAIDLISAHGTATIYNDDMESIAFHRHGLDTTPVHSLKGYYGHCLGASGLLESIIAMECAATSTYLPSRNFTTIGTTQPLHIIEKVQSGNIQFILKTGSGFGGSNTALILEKIQTS